MSSEAEHIAIANRNQAVLEYLLHGPATCAEWVAVVAFYKALHVVEAIFSRDSTIGHIHNHHTRLDKLKREKQYKKLFSSYRVLWSAAIVARYLEDRSPTTGAGAGRLYSRFQDYMPIADLRPMLLDQFLASFERDAATFLTPSCGGLSLYAPANAQLRQSVSGQASRTGTGI